jgi:hypothetical protein
MVDRPEEKIAEDGRIPVALPSPLAVTRPEAPLGDTPSMSADQAGRRRSRGRVVRQGSVTGHPNFIDVVVT